MKLKIIVILFFVLPITAPSQEVDAPPVHYVSVDPVNRATTISWQAPATPGIAFYEIYRVVDEGGNNVLYTIDTVYADEALTYTDSSARQHPMRFSVAAIDSAGQKSLAQYVHTSMAISSISFDSCRASATITWTPYAGWQKGVEGYTIRYLDGIQAGETDSSQTRFTVEGLEHDSTYCFYIEASSTDGYYSTTYRGCVASRLPQGPVQMTALGADVSESSVVELTFEVEAGPSDITAYKLLHSTNAEHYDTVATLPGGNTSPHAQHETPTHRLNYYRLAAIGPCGTVFGLSPVASTCHLQTEKEGSTVRLSWNQPMGITALRNYYLYADNGSGQFVNTALIDSGHLTYEYDLREYYGQGTGSRFCFYLEAETATGQRPRSNTACVDQDPGILMPEAFTPNGDGLNDHYMPVMTFLPEGEYLFRIIDRYGEVIFETKDPTQGWDGTINGLHAPTGVYVYALGMQKPDGSRIEKNGTVVLVRGE